MQKSFDNADKAQSTKPSQCDRPLFQTVNDADAAAINGGWTFVGAPIKRQPLKIVIDFTSAG